MPGHECYHCKQWVEEGEAHDCWTTTESALTAELSEELREAWERLRETAAELGEQRIYASHNSIMFARKSCYFFVRPKRTFLEVCIFLGRPVNAPQIRRVDRASKLKVAHMLRVTHRDQVEAPLTDWLQEAYALFDQPAPVAAPAPTPSRKNSRKTVKKPAPKTARKAARKTTRTAAVSTRKKTASKRVAAKAGARRPSRKR